MEEIKILSTSRASAITDDFVLREKETTRLIFRPLLVDNAQNQDASVKGIFIFQRKSKKQQWEDFSTLNLSQLKSGEWIKLALNSAEILKLYKHLGDLYKIYEQEGIPLGQSHFVRADEGLISLLATNETELTQLLNREHGDASRLLSRLLFWLSKIDNPGQVLESLEQLEINGLQKLSSLVGITTLRLSYELWEHNKENSDEEYWQTVLSKYSFILSQVFSHPVVIVKGKAYVGGKDIANSGGNLVDFLAQNDVSKNAVLIEIKTPKTRLLGSQYRSVYSISPELSGTVVQVANYKRSLEQEFSSLESRGNFDIESFEPHCVIVAGNYKSELDTPAKKKSFELFRSRLQGIELITYDELFGKVCLLVDLLEGKISGCDIVPDENIPF